MADAPPVEDDAAPAAPDDDPRHPGLACSECGQTIKGKGGFTDAAALGAHKRREHGIAGSHASSTRARASRASKRAKKAESSSSAASTATTPIALVHDIRDAAKGRGAPTAAQLTGALGKAYGYATVLGASVVLSGAPIADEAREQLIDYLSATEDEAAATMAPIARVLAKTEVVKRYGRGAIDNADVLDAVAAVAQQTVRWRTALRELRGLSAAPAAPTVPAPGFPPEPGAGAVPTSESFDPRFAYVPPPTQGVVVTPGMVGRPDLEAEFRARGEE